MACDRWAVQASWRREQQNRATCPGLIVPGRAVSVFPGLESLEDTCHNGSWLGC
uniref:Uncharacterized protein n=1 Tax=Arundo donax TaxID=35708 RepID=A0A0A9ENN9_ARUDO